MRVSWKGGAVREAPKALQAGLAVFLAAILALGAAAVLSRKSTGSVEVASGVIHLRMAEIQPPDHPTAKADFEFARLVEEASGGRIRISVYADSRLGQELAVLEQLRFGAIDLARVSLSAVAASVPRLQVLQLPYIYRDADHMWGVLQGEIGGELLGSLSSEGLLGIGWFEAGARSFYTSSGPVRHPGDLAGKTIRVQENSIMEATVASFGARPWPRAFGEVFQALRTGQIEGAENNLATYYSSGHWRVAPWFTATEHARVPEMVVGSALALSGLTAEDRALLMKAGEKAAVFQRKAWREYEEDIVQRLEAEGARIVRALRPEDWVSLTARVSAGQNPEERALVRRIKALR